MSKHIVVRTFPAHVVIVPGQVYDTSAWPNRAFLESQGYIRPVDEPAPAPEGAPSQEKVATADPSSETPTADKTRRTRIK